MKLTTGLTLAAALAVVACGGDKDATPPATTMAPAATMAPAGGTPALSSVAAGDFGVPACDEYMRKYMACIEGKVPEGAKAMMRSQMEQTKMAWQQAASTPQGKAGLANACTQADTAAKQAMSAYGCKW